MSLQYLKPTIKAEPLIWNWYAWSYLIPPVTAGCNIAERHLKIMQSYVQNPNIHSQAVKDPKLIGGPFIDLDGEKVEEIKELINQTKNDCDILLQLNNAFKELDKILQTEAQGDTLDPFYNRTPGPLKGMIELIYDLNSQPSIRLIEPLIYKKYYSTQNQSIALADLNSDFRKFVFSTPRINQDDEVYLDVPFSDPNLDKLFKMKEEPQKLNDIQTLFNIPSSKVDLFQSFFSSTPPEMGDDRNYRGEGVRVRYFGHSCVLLQTKSVSILLDPVISYPINNQEVPRYTLADLPDHIDYVIITHNHQDHIMFETLLQLRYKIGSIVIPSNNTGALEDPSLKLILKNIGFLSLMELKEMDNISFEDGEIMALPFFGEHCDLNIQSKLSYNIRLKNKNFLFAADSNNLDQSLYEHIFEYIGPIDTLFLGMECDGGSLTWFYGPLLSSPLKRTHDKNRTLSGSNFEKAWKIAEASKCKQAYVYAMGQEPWLRHVMALDYTPESIQITESNRFISKCRESGIESERLFGKKEWIFNS